MKTSTPLKHDTSSVAKKRKKTPLNVGPLIRMIQSSGQPKGNLHFIEIINLVRYIPVESSGSSLSINLGLRAQGLPVHVHGMKSVLAIWPDQVQSIMIFPKRQVRPTREQLLNAYRNACIEDQGGEV
jgi:hypothetical protein